MKELKGKIIQSYKLEEGGTKLTIETKERILVYETYGDCCSHSWFSDIEGIGNLIGEKVISVTEREEWGINEVKKAERQGDYDVLALYGYLIKTAKGTCDIEFRNDSNGYYGGWCELTSNIKKDEKSN